MVSKAHKDVVLWLPSGIIAKDETPEMCVQRELKEEIGFAGSPTYVGWYHPSSRSLQKAYVYRVEVTNGGITHRDKTENQQVVILPIERAPTLFQKGAFKHAPTLVTLGLCQVMLY